MQRHSPRRHDGKRVIGSCGSTSAIPSNTSSNVAANAKPLAKYGAHFLVAPARTRTSKAARAPQRGDRVPDYQAALRVLEVARIPGGDEAAHRVSTADVVIIEGYDGPQPA